MCRVYPYSNEKEFPLFQNYNIENYNGHFLDIGNNEISNEKNEELLNLISKSSNLVDDIEQTPLNTPSLVQNGTIPVSYESNLVDDIEPAPLNTPSLIQTDTIPVSYESTPVNVTYVPESSFANYENVPTISNENISTPEISDEKESSDDLDEVVNSLSKTETNISNTETNIITEEEESNEINVTNNYFNFFNRHKICPIRMSIIFLLTVIIGMLFFLK